MLGRLGFTISRLSAGERVLHSPLQIREGCLRVGVERSFGSQPSPELLGEFPYTSIRHLPSIARASRGRLPPRGYPRPS